MNFTSQSCLRRLMKLWRNLIDILLTLSIQQNQELILHSKRFAQNQVCH